MEKDEAIVDFLKGLRIVINNASAYSKEHPYFRKSVEVFKQKVDALFSYLSPIKIGVTANSLLIDDRYWEKLTLYTDLTQIFHYRKIKSAEFREGITVDELITFLNLIAQPVREILKQGGAKNVLSRGDNPHIFIEELDYSELLGEEGEEVKDIWSYLIRDAVDREDQARINEFADNFEKIVGKFKAKDICEDEELRQNIHVFLIYLKGKENDKFYNCVKALLKVIIRDKNASSDARLEKIREFFTDLKRDDLTEVLWEEISKEGKFDYLSFIVFSRLFDEEENKDIALGLEKKIKSSDFIKTNPKIRKRIRELFSMPTADASYISANYLNALSWLSDENIPDEGLSFNRALIHASYRFLLLNLLDKENTLESLHLISNCLLDECNMIIEEANYEHAKLILDILDQKIKNHSELEEIFEGLKGRIYSFIENSFFEEKGIASPAPFIDKIDRSYLGHNFYLDKIFNEGKVNSYVLKLYLRLFTDALPEFYENLEKKHSEVEFLGKIIKGLEGLDSLITIVILKKIFFISNNIIKAEVLKSMQTLSNIDEEFLFYILKYADYFLKSESLVILARDERTKKAALESLFSIPGYFGQQNKLLIENIEVAENIDLRDAYEYLLAFSKRPFFWNRNLRKKSSQALEKWNVRKD